MYQKPPRRGRIHFIIRLQGVSYQAVAIFGGPKVDAIQRAFMDTAEKNLDKRIDASEVAS